jgi:hypothetical protein
MKIRQQERGGGHKWIAEDRLRKEKGRKKGHRLQKSTSKAKKKQRKET